MSVTSATKPVASRKSRRGAGRAFTLALALAALSGGAALGHEVLWTRRLIDLLGASGSSTARVFGGFFFGLALGSAWAARRIGQVARPWRSAAIAEVVIGLCALPALFLPEWTGWIWPSLGPDQLTGPAGGLVKLAISAIALLPPSIAMGWVMPSVAAAVLTGPRRLDWDGLWLYAVNTLGGVLGLVSVLFFGLPALGSAGAMTAMIGLNLLVASGFLGVDRLTHRSVPVAGQVVDLPAVPVDSVRIGLGWIDVVAFVSGLGLLTAEVVGMHLLSLGAPLSFYTPAVILAVTILLLGLAALAAPSMFGPDREPAERRLPGLLAICGLAMTLTPPLFLIVTSQRGALDGSATLPEFLTRLTALALACLGPTLFAAGLIFPALISWAERDSKTAGDRGRRLGRLLAINGLGGLIGAELANVLVLPNFGIHGGLAAIGAVYATVGLALAWGMRRRDPAARTTVQRSAALLLVVVSLGVGWTAGMPHRNVFLGFRVLDEQFGREGAVAVIESDRTGRSILMSNQYVLGGSAVRWNQERQAHLPLLLHPEPRSVAFIGLATGITPGGALEHSAVERITAVEIAPLVARAAELFFGEFNHEVTRDPRVRVVEEDGRTFIESAQNHYDVIIGDLFLPWGPGEARLFTVEHFRAVRRSLRPGGVYCQWLPAYQLTPDQLVLIVESFRRAFPEIHLLRNGFESHRPMLGLVGFREGTLDWSVVARRCEEVRLSSNGPLDPSVRHAEVVAMLYLGTWPKLAVAGPANTLGNLRLEIDASRERLTGQPGEKYLWGKRWLQFVRHRIGLMEREADPGAMEDIPGLSVIDLVRKGFLLSAWEWKRLASQARSAPPVATRPPLPDDIVALLPTNAVSDHAADWRRWPGSPPAPKPDSTSIPE